MYSPSHWHKYKVSLLTIELLCVYPFISVFYMIVRFNSRVRKCRKIPTFTARMLVVLLVLNWMNSDSLDNSSLKHSEGCLVQAVQNMTESNNLKNESYNKGRVEGGGGYS